MKRKIVTVKFGPGVWLGQRGWLVLDDGDFVVGRFWAKDDGGAGVYDLRLPKACVTVEDEPNQA